MCCAVSSYLSQRTADGGTDSRKVNSRPVPGLEKSQIRFVLSLIDYASYTEPTLECSTYNTCSDSLILPSCTMSREALAIKCIHITVSCSQATSVSSAVTTSAPQPQATDCVSCHNCTCYIFIIVVSIC